MHYQRDGRAGLAGFVRNSKSLTISGDIEPAENPVGSSSKKCMSGANFKTRPVGLHFSSHHFVVRGKVENLLTVTPPAGAATSCGRNLPLPARAREWHNIDLIVA